MFQVFGVTCTSFLPLLFWIYPRYAAYYAGVDGQWAVLGACVIGLYSAWMHGLLNARFPHWSGADMPSLVFGKRIGKIMTFLFIPGYLLFIALSIYSFSITIKMLLPNTPRLATVTALTLVSVYGALYGLEAIARVVAIILPVVLLVLGISFSVVLFQGTWTGIFLYPSSFSRCVSGVSQLLPMFFGLNLHLMLSPYYDHRGRNPIWLPLFTVAFATVYIMFIYLTEIRVVGYVGLSVLAHPVDFILELVQLQGLIVQRFGVVLIFISTLFQAVFVSNHLWALSETSRQLFETQKATDKWFIVSYAVIIIVIFQFIPNQQVGDWVVRTILVPLSWFYLVIEPTIKLLGSYVGGMRTRMAQN